MCGSLDSKRLREVAGAAVASASEAQATRAVCTGVAAFEGLKPAAHVAHVTAAPGAHVMRLACPTITVGRVKNVAVASGSGHGQSEGAVDRLEGWPPQGPLHRRRPPDHPSYIVSAPVPGIATGGWQSGRTPASPGAGLMASRRTGRARPPCRYRPPRAPQIAVSVLSATGFNSLNGCRLRMLAIRSVCSCWYGFSVLARPLPRVRPADLVAAAVLRVRSCPSCR